MQQPKPDLTLSDIPNIRNVTLDLALIDASKITLMDAFDIQEKSGIDASRFGTVLKTEGPERARMLYAFAWVIARRVEPGLTWDEMLTYNLEIIGEPMSAEQQEHETEKARAVMNVVRLAGVSPDEARDMSMAEVAAVLPPKRRRRAAR